MSDNDIQEALEEADGEQSGSSAGGNSGGESGGSSGSVMGNFGLSRKQLLALGILAVVVLLVWQMKSDGGDESPSGQGALDDARSADMSHDVEVNNKQDADPEVESYRVPDGSRDELDKDAYILDESGIFTTVGKNGSFENQQQGAA